MNNKRKIIRRIIEISVLVGFSCFLFLSCKGGKQNNEPVIYTNTGTEDSQRTSENTEEDTYESGSSNPAREEFSSGNDTGKAVVYVCGSVVNPGVYELPGGSRIIDAIHCAGGFSEDANREFVNLADFITDGQMIRIPDSSEDVSLLQSSENSEESSFPVNINTATKEKLCTIPGVGDVRAEAILKYRTENGSFHSTEELMNVPGIKEGTYNKIKEYVKVQ